MYRKKKKAILSGGSVVVGPHDLNDQYHLTTSLLFPKFEKNETSMVYRQPEGQEGKRFI